jgi:murein L,D-transpeptidase YcbB/YkuD
MKTKNSTVQRIRASFYPLTFILCLVVATMPAASAQDSLAPQIQKSVETLPATIKAGIRTDLASMYQRRSYSPLWIQSNSLTPQGLALLKVMNAAARDGLNPLDYNAAELSTRATTMTQGSHTAAEWAAFDVAISTSGATFANHLHYGRVDARAAGFDMPVRSNTLDVGVLLEQIATQGTDGAFEKIEPPFQHYRTLENVLVEYRRLAAQPPLNALPSFAGKSIKAGESYAGAPALRTFLVALGDLPVEAKAADDVLVLDNALVTALKSFQFRHGLEQDGALGKGTYAALIRPLADRVKQIELTLERFRWLPALDAPTIIVNIPQFRLFAFDSTGDHEAQMLTMNVIVGKTFPANRTPVFAGDMKYLIFRPYWDVPFSITKKELVPHIRRDPAYMAAENLEIVNSQSDRAVVVDPTPENLDLLESGKYRLRQRPGEDNSLGLVKFMLPNHYNVYLHSTPAKQLFQQTRRAFSHGCIRVSDPTALAEYVLKNAPGEWTREKIADAMQNHDNERVNLTQNIRVLILYGTAIATEAGKVYFFEDIYGNDLRLANLLAQRSYQ